MAVYRVQGPDGQVHRFEGPDGASPQEVEAAAAQQFSAPAITSKPAPKAMTREEAIKATARQQVALEKSKQTFGAPEQGFGADVMDFLKSGQYALTNAVTLGQAPRIEAAISSLKDGVSYDDALAYTREREKAQRDRSVTGDIAGSIAGGVGIGTGLASGATRVAEAGLPIISRGANYLSNILNLQRGQTVGNLARLTTQGAAYGAATASGAGDNVGEGAALGGAAAGGLGVLGNVAGSALRHYSRPFWGAIDETAGAGRRLREVITQNPDELADAQRHLSTRAGGNVPLAAALNERDVGNVSKQVLKGSPEAVQQAGLRVAEETRNMQNRMINLVQGAADRSATRTNNQIDLPSGRQVGLPLQGTVNDLMQFRNQTASEMMDPIRDNLVDLSGFDAANLERRLAQRAGGRIQTLAGRINRALRDLTPTEMQRFDVTPTDMRQARQLLHQWGLRGPVNITVGEADSLRRTFSAAGQAARKAGNTPDAAAYDNAASEIRRLVPYPEYGDMIDAYAANQRMIKGFETAASGKRLSDVAKQDVDAQLRTPEGRIGMRIGELHRLREKVGDTPSAAINLASELGSGGKLTRQANIQNPMAAQPGTVTENIDPQMAAELAQGGQANSDAHQKLMRIGRVSANDQSDKLLDNPETLAYGATLLAGPSMGWTKARFAARVLGMMPTGTSPQVSRNVVDMLFSSDPAQTQQALNLLRRLGIGERVQRLIGAPAGQIGGSMAQPDRPPAQAPAAPQPAPEAAPGPQSDASPYDTQLQQFVSSQPPEFADLAARNETAESHGDQDAVSSRGALGVMQVMPGTAPEAAALAGVPFDENLYKTDEAYNRLIGTYYLADMLKRFDGDTAKALAAYNWGLGHVQEAIAKSGDDWASHLPDETRDHIRKVMNG
jgi:hypothetical protein